MNAIEGISSPSWDLTQADATGMEPALTDSGVQDDTEIENALMAVGNQDTTPGGSLGKNEFLNLLVTQLSSQDPLNPMDSSESIAQLAQFSALEQMQNVNVQLEAQRKSSGLIDAMLLQDQNIEATLQNGSTVQGTVEKMTWQGGEMVMQINGALYPASSLIGLRLLSAVTPVVVPEIPDDDTLSTETIQETEELPAVNTP